MHETTATTKKCETLAAMAETMRDMGNRIAQRRAALGLTQVELARDLGTSQQTIAKWERGQGFGPVPRFVALAERLGCTVGELIDGGDAAPPPSVEAAIMADEQLDRVGREALLRSYRAMARRG